MEAGVTLRNNRARVLKDVCNPSTTMNIESKPLTQLELIRVDAKHEAIADEALREIERRLLAQGASDPITEVDRSVWAAVATYLDGRIQSMDKQKPGRKPDMSAPAADAMREVLHQLRSMTHSREAREEAGWRLRNNRACVLKDVCNPNPRFNIDGKPLTQLDLNRLAPEHESLADEALREIERRLLGEGMSVPVTEEAGHVWSAVASYLNGRIQGTP